MNLTPHFTLEEMTFSQTAIRRGIDNTPTPEHFRNLRRLCSLLEDVRDVIGSPIRITSGYRCEELNGLVGGAKNSQHMIGCAADIKPVSMDLGEAIEVIIDADIEFDQLILEFNSWIHISVPNTQTDKPRKQVLIIDSEGTRPWLQS